MAKKVDFEAVIAAKDMQDTIGETIQSMVDSSVPPQKIWVVDDGSSDKTSEIAATYKDVELLVNKTNKDTSYSRNRAIKKCTAKYIFVIDADDLVKYDKFEIHLNYLEKNKQVDAVYGDKISFWESFESSNIGDINTYEDVDDLLSEQLKKNTIIPGMMFFRSSFFEDYGLFDENIHIANDRELYIRGLVNGAHIHYNPAAVTYYRRHKKSMLATRYREGIYNNYLTLIKHFNSIMALKDGKYGKELSTSLRMMARNLNIYGFPFRDVRKCLKLAAKAYPMWDIEQKTLYNYMDKLMGAIWTERLLRPKFKLDHLLGRY